MKITVDTMFGHMLAFAFESFIAFGLIYLIYRVIWRYPALQERVFQKKRWLQFLNKGLGTICMGIGVCIMLFSLLGIFRGLYVSLAIGQGGPVDEMNNFWFPLQTTLKVVVCTLITGVLLYGWVMAGATIRNSWKYPRLA